MHEIIHQSTKIMNSTEKFTYLQPTRGNRHCAPILTTTEIFIKNIDELDHTCMQQNKAHKATHVYHNWRVSVGGIKNPG